MVNMTSSSRMLFRVGYIQVPHVRLSCSGMKKKRAKEYGLSHVPEVDCDEYGTLLNNSMLSVRYGIRNPLSPRDYYQGMDVKDNNLYLSRALL